ncbi:MAG: baseplate J/gp47 family protein [Anaerolineales bacterium]
MKTQIIQLEPHDDTISVKDKMGWSQTGRIALVWPARGHLIDRQLDLVLLLRHSQDLGIQIALVTTDPEVRFQAGQLGIPMFRSIRKAQTEHWKRKYRKSGKFKSKTAWDQRLSRIQTLLAEPVLPNREVGQLPQPVRIGIFSLAVIAVLSIAAVLIPSAQIYITPETSTQAITLDVQANDKVEQINLTGILPAKWTSVSVEGRSSTQTTGSENIPLGYASGEVVFRNLTDQALVIPAGTVVGTANLSHRYATQREIRIPAGSGQENSVSIKAISPGSSSNLAAGRILAIEGELGVLATVANLTPVSGGSMALSPAPNSEDRERLQEELIGSLSQNALQEIKDFLSPGDILLSEEPTLVRISSASFDPEDLQPASQLDLTLRAEFTIPYVSAEDIDTLGSSILDANLPAGYAALPDTMHIEQLSDPIFDNGLTNSWRIEFSRGLQSEPSVQQATNLVLGRKPEHASQLLRENLSITGTPRIKTSPSWWPVVPFVPIRIQVISSEIIQASDQDALQGIQ